MNASDIFLLHPFPSARERCLRSAPSAPSPVPSSCPPIIPAPLPLSQKFYPPLPPHRARSGLWPRPEVLIFLSAAGRPQRGGEILLPIFWGSFSSRWASRPRINNITIACRLTYIQIILLPDEITDHLLLAFRRPLSWLRGALCALRRLFWKLGRPLRWLRRALSPFRRTLRQLGRTLCPLRRPLRWRGRTLRRFRRPLSRPDLPPRAVHLQSGTADYCKSWSDQRTCLVYCVANKVNYVCLKRARCKEHRREPGP